MSPYHLQNELMVYNTVETPYSVSKFVEIAHFDYDCICRLYRIENLENPLLKNAT
jgi:hypothetical protein